MDRVRLILVAAAVGLHAQVPPPNLEAKRIASVLAAMNSALSAPEVKDFAALFVSDGDLRIAGEVVAGPKAIADRLSSRPAWDEVTPPRIEKKSIRLVTPDVAIVDASWVQYGSMIVKREWPVLLLLKKDGARWRVSSLRVGDGSMADSPCKGCVVRVSPDDDEE
ncbi:MAG: hypothetical protein KIT09_27215 [Bryobacteraceae bacterium]|nr:hypothetical protein [Bryobacteraceae bacterium]